MYDTFCWDIFKTYLGDQAKYCKFEKTKKTSKWSDVDASAPRNLPSPLVLSLSASSIWPAAPFVVWWLVFYVWWFCFEQCWLVLLSCFDLCCLFSVEFSFHFNDFMIGHGSRMVDGFTLSTVNVGFLQCQPTCQSQAKLPARWSSLSRVSVSPNLCRRRGAQVLWEDVWFRDGETLTFRKSTDVNSLLTKDFGMSQSSFIDNWWTWYDMMMSYFPKNSQFTACRKCGRFPPGTLPHCGAVSCHRLWSFASRFWNKPRRHTRQTIKTNQIQQQTTNWAKHNIQAV